MTFLHKLVLGGEIAAATVAGLIVISAGMATVRAMFSKEEPPFTVQAIPFYMAQVAKESWAHRQIVAFDIACNVIILRGQQDETISTHCWRAQQEGKLWGKLACMWLNGFQPNHGFKAATGDLQRASARVAVLKKALGIS